MLQTWMGEYLDMFKISELVVIFMMKAIDKLIVSVEAGGKNARRGKELKEYFSGRLIIVTTISYCNNVTREKELANVHELY